MNIYELAKQTVEAKRRWTSGESVTIWQNGSTKATVHEGGRDGGGLLFLRFHRDGHVVAQTTCGILSMTGWMFTLTDNEYTAWVRQARR